jgi:hypothetical protein
MGVALQSWTDWQVVTGDCIGGLVRTIGVRELKAHLGATLPTKPRVPFRAPGLEPMPDGTAAKLLDWVRGDRFRRVPDRT